MRVYCLIPVHNRLRETRAVLQCLAAQDYPELSTVIVDDGSTDGTGEAIRRDYPGVTLIEGDGLLWWGGAMATGLDFILPRAKKDDYVLFQNNDTSFTPDYVSTLVSVSRAHDGAVVGSVTKDVDRPEVVLTIAPRIDYWKVRTVDLLETYEVGSGRPNGGLGLPEAIDADALCGRGTLYPVSVFRRVGGVRHRLLPHYLADYEMSARAKAAGFRTIVSTRAVVWTESKLSGIEETAATWGERLFDRRSRTNMVDSMAFFTLCGPWYLRPTGALRVVFFRLWGAVRRKCFAWR